VRFSIVHAPVRCFANGSQFCFDPSAHAKQESRRRSSVGVSRLNRSAKDRCIRPMINPLTIVRARKREYAEELARPAPSD
jgi:hypothetical protein